VHGVDTCTYEAQASGSSPVRTAATTLAIDVTGIDDAAKITIPGDNLRFIKNGTAADASSAEAFLTVVDKDAGDSVLKGLSTTAGANPSLIGHNGALVITTTTKTGAYAWNYTKNSGAVHKASVVQHDLFTFESNDGTAKSTLDFKLEETDKSKPIAAHEAYGQVTTVDTLDFSDVKQQLVLDFTQPTTATSDTLLMATSVEKIDITGGPANIGSYQNTIKLNLSSLLQTDTFNGTNHRLYIKGDAGDTVQFDLDNSPTTIAHDAAALVVDGTSYWVYHINNDELLVQTAIANITVNG
jgi:VCBS repeat-containing protein